MPRNSSTFNQVGEVGRTPFKGWLNYNPVKEDVDAAQQLLLDKPADAMDALEELLQQGFSVSIKFVPDDEAFRVVVTDHDSRRATYGYCMSLYATHVDRVLSLVAVIVCDKFAYQLGSLIGDGQSKRASF